MNFLEIVQQIAEEVDAADAPDTVVAQTGEAGNYVRWARSAYRDIQLRHGGRWEWLKRKFTLETTDTVGSYTSLDATDDDAAATIARFRDWHLTDRNVPPKMYRTADGVAGQVWLIWIPWEHFQQIYRIGTQPTGMPAHISSDPHKRLVLGLTPNDAYTVQGDFYRSAQVLAADADEPEMPEDFHELIVYGAMVKYGYQQAAPEVVQRANAEFRRMMRQLESDQLPAMRIAGPLA